MIYPKNPYCPMNGDCGCPGNGSNNGNTGNSGNNGNNNNNNNNNNQWQDNNTQWPDMNRPDNNRPDNNRPGNNCPGNNRPDYCPDDGNSGNMSKSEMLKRISELDFAITDLNLYLDTHPENKEALEMLTKLAATCKSLKADFTQKYGPLLVTDVMNETPFSWVSPEHKWPWQA